jgi:hypothetical protein
VTVRGEVPVKLHADEPLRVTHKIHFDFGTKGGFEIPFNGGVRAEVYEVIHMEE